MTTQVTPLKLPSRLSSARTRSGLRLFLWTQDQGDPALQCSANLSRITHGMRQPFAQAPHCAFAGKAGCSPCLLQPLDAFVEAFTFDHHLAHVIGQGGHDVGFAGGKIGDQPSVPAQLQFRKFARKIGAMVKQPCQTMHYPRRRSQCLARYLDAVQILTSFVTSIIAGLRSQDVPLPFKPGAHVVCQAQGFGIERFNDARVKAGHKGHGFFA